MLLLVLLGLSPAFSSRTPSQICEGDVCFEAQAPAGDEQLPLRGLGKLRYWGFSIYTAALYLDGDSHDPRQFLAAQPKRLVLHYHRTITGEQIVAATEKALSRLPESEVARVRGSFDHVNALYSDVRDGDRYELVYEPGEGTTLIFNGEEVDTIEGVEFARALFGIWLADHALSESLRDRLLGKR